jgi:EAL domain-containing protein (putative c-di-GMP-specific phosphodiesterase class I)
VSGRPDSPHRSLPQLVEDVAALQARSAREQRQVVVTAVLISNAADVADRYGVAGLEAVTAELARRLAGGEPGAVLHTSSFGSLVAGRLVAPEDAEPQVRDLMIALRDFVQVQGEQVWPVVSVATRVCGAGDSPATVLADVRSTLMAVDRRAPGTTRWCDGALPPAPLDRLSLVRDLASALRHEPEQLALAFQPVVDLSTGKVTGAEALLRWPHPVRGPVSPIEAVDAAERSGLIHELGHHVLELGLAQVARWLAADADGRPFTLHVNVSPHQLRAPGFAGDVAERMAAHGIPREALLLELTESDLMTGDDQIAGSVAELAALGVRLGIDDFGTGYSSIAQLQLLPVDTVKVDRSLVSGIGSSPAAFDLLRGILGLLATSDVTVIAEGVESALQVAHLRALGCHTAQGYHLGRPVPAGQFPLGASAATFAS